MHSTHPFHVCAYRYHVHYSCSHGLYTIVDIMQLNDKPCVCRPIEFVFNHRCRPGSNRADFHFNTCRRTIAKPQTQTYTTYPSDCLHHISSSTQVIIIHSSDTDGRAILGRFQTTSQTNYDDIDVRATVESIVEFEPKLDNFVDHLMDMKSAQSRVYLLYAKWVHSVIYWAVLCTVMMLCAQLRG